MNAYLRMTLLSVMVLIFSNGCASYMVYKSSEQRVATRKAFANGDQAAIRAVQLGNNGVGIGFDISNWEALTEQPWMQIGAAIWDAALIYTGKKTIDSSNNNNTPSVTISPTGSGNNITVVNGNNNTISSTRDNTFEK